MQDDRANIFFQAEKDIANMLADNLLNTFKATNEYKELVGNIEFGAQLFPACYPSKGDGLKRPLQKDDVEPDLTPGTEK